MSHEHSPSNPRRRRVARLGLVLGASVCLAWGACKEPPERAAGPIVFYPSAPAPPRIQFLRSISSDKDLEDQQSSLDNLLFGEQEKTKVIRAAYGCAVRDGKVYLCDPRLGGVIVIDLAAQTMDPMPASGRGGLISPINLAFAADGRLYVADSTRSQIVVYGPDLAYEAEFGPFGTDGGRLVEVEVTEDRLYVIDVKAKLVRVLDRRSGEELFSFGQRQISQEILVAPTNLTIDSEGNVYVVDTIRCEILVFDSEGVYLRTLGLLGDGAGAFARPKGIAYDDDRLFVLDAAFANCQILGLDGTPIMFFGGAGNGPGQMYLPSAVWVGTDGLKYFERDLVDTFQAQRLIITTNQYGPRKVNFYALGEDRRFDYDAYEAEFNRKRAEAEVRAEAQAEAQAEAARAEEEGT